MGMYTKLHCNIKLKKDEKTKDFIINCGFLQCCSYYFTGTNNTKLLDNDYQYVLHCDCDFKNYYGETETFFKEISEYIPDKEYCSKEFIGYMRYEESDYPTLLFIENNKVIEEEISNI